jgi:hypothetical protein
MSVSDYVIGGMDPDFRELLYHAGLAMDLAGIHWTILSGFRDDYRQSIAAGLKAHPGNSFHGGSIATGGYGHGCAADLASADGVSNQDVWQWLAVHGAEFGLQRPLPAVDPAHVQPRGAWHGLAAVLTRLSQLEGLRLIKAHKAGLRIKRSPLHLMRWRGAGGGDPWRGLRWQRELELVHDELLIAGELGAATEDQGAAVGRGEVNVEHLDRRELVEHRPRG